jgi:RNA polymerase sigma-70 factor (sigma-E family)
MNLAWTEESAPPLHRDGAIGASTTIEGRSTTDPSPWAETPDRDGEFRRLYERCHADMVRFAAFLTGDVACAEDVAQDAFARVFDAWDRIDDHERIDAYLKSTVVNIVHGRRRKREVADRSTTPPPLTVVPSAEEDAVGRIGRDKVLAAVSALPLRQKACVVMRHWMRMSESEIAESLELSVGSVRTHVKRGTESLKKSLGDQR